MVQLAINAKVVRNEVQLVAGEAEVLLDRPVQIHLILWWWWGIAVLQELAIQGRDVELYPVVVDDSVGLVEEPMCCIQHVLATVVEEGLEGYLLLTLPLGCEAEGIPRLLDLVDCDVLIK